MPNTPFDWACHAPGRLTTSLDLKPGPERIAATAGYQQVEGVASGRVADDWWARWEAGGARFTLHVKAAEQSEVFTGAGPGKNPADRVPVLIVRRRGRSATYDVIHDFV
jgi:hypothetical protein